MNEFQDAFVSYEEADSSTFILQLSQQLTEQGYRVWLDPSNNSSTDQLSSECQVALEKSHNFLFVATPSSVSSPHCLSAIALANRYNKRVICLRHIDIQSQEDWQAQNPDGTDEDWSTYQAEGKHVHSPPLPELMGEVTQINFSPTANNFEQVSTDLIAQLEHKRSFIQRHTALLNQALVWERARKSPQHLLTGDEQNLAVAWLNTYSQAALWLKTTAQTNTGLGPPPQTSLCKPTDLHCEFIGESKKKANDWMTDVVLCHAPSDQEFAEKIRQVLMQQGTTIWAGATPEQAGDEPEGGQWSEAQAAIEAADHVIYLISPSAIQCQPCQQGIRYALSLNKSVLPLLVELTQLNALPPEQQTLSFTDFTRHRDPAQYYVTLDQFLYKLNEDRAYYAMGKGLLVKALKWERQQQDPSLWLQGVELEQAEQWLNQGLGKKVAPTVLHQRYIKASRQQDNSAADIDNSKSERGLAKIFSIFSRR